MGSSNKGRENIRKLNEHKTMPIKLMGGRMNLFMTVFHVSKPKLSSNSSKYKGVDVKVKLDMILIFDYI